MGDPSHDDLRRLAGWLSRRREVDEAMAVLTRYGPAAGNKVAASLDALRALLADEAEAFDRYASAAPVLPQRPLPTTVPDEPAAVRSLDAARLTRRPG